MKTLPVIVFMFVLVSCKKSDPELSQRDREISEPLLQNQLIAYEKEGVRIDLTYQSGSVMLSGQYLKTTEAGRSYYFDDMPENSETVIQAEYTGSGTFDMLCEGFTAIGNTKRFEEKGLKIKSGKQDLMRIKKGIVKYTFIML